MIESMPFMIGHPVGASKTCVFSVDNAGLETREALGIKNNLSLPSRILRSYPFWTSPSSVFLYLITGLPGRCPAGDNLSYQEQQSHPPYQWDG